MRTMTNYTPPDWILEALESLRPPEYKSVSEWADARRVLDAKSAAMPGRWRTEVTPYLADVMDAFSDPDVEELSFVKSTQVGGTEALLNMLGYAIDQDPGAAMLTYPTDKLGEFAAKNRVQPMIDVSPQLRGKYRPGSSTLLLMQFSEMYLVVTGASSPSSLGNYPVRYLLMDEVDKYPLAAGKEANPRALARERTRTYDTSRKIVNACTPTFESGPIWQEWLAAETQYENAVRCPHCGAEWTFKFSSLRFETESPERARETAVYVCEAEGCGGVISDSDKIEMVRGGKWVAIRGGSRRRIAYRITAFYSPWLRFGDIAYEFVRSKNDPSLLMNFVNSWLAEPYKEVETTISAEWLLENRQSDYPPEEPPPDAIMLTGGVDVQKACMYWTIRAWLPSMASYNILHGEAFSWQEIENIMNRTYYDRDGRQHIVNLCAVDSGDQTDDVYDFCARNREWAVPIKGASTRLQGKFRRSVIDRIGHRAHGQVLYLVDSNYYKDMLFARMRRDVDEGGWYIYDGCSPEYCEMITAEHKVVRRYSGRLASVWEPKASGRDNHYLDCEVYAALAADLCGLRDIGAQEAQRVAAEPDPPAQQPPPAPTRGDDALNRSRLKLKRGWFDR